MFSYVALLRGVNVGGKNKLVMAELVELMQQQGLREVKSYIQSGNLVFKTETEYRAQELEALIGQEFDFRPRVFLFQKHHFEQMMLANPYADKPGNKVHVYFYQQHQVDLQKLESYLATDEEYLLSDSAFYLFAPAGVGRSKLVANVERILACQATGRNLNTLNKLWQMIEKT